MKRVTMVGHPRANGGGTTMKAAGDVRVRTLAVALGAEILGVDLSSDIDDAVFARIHRAFLDHHVLLFRNQELTPDHHIAFSRRFGELAHHVIDQYLLPGHPEILQLSNGRRNGTYFGLPDAGGHWHSDLAYEERPSLGSLLYALRIPPRGGDTMFTNMYLAYETLPAATRARIDGLRATNRTRRTLADANDFKVRMTTAQLARIPTVVHPVVRTHPETGRKALYVSEAHTEKIVGMDEAESAALLTELYAHSVRDRFVYRHRWRVGDLIMWDNRCTMHKVTPFDRRHVRHLHRTTVRGDRPV
jgi:taurine dioxygenase